MIEKSIEGFKLSIYNESLASIESASFRDSYTLNFQLQALAKKHRIDTSLVIKHDKERNVVDLSLANGEISFFVS
ncbi:MAG: hypothetical protein M3270_10255 [Thermoproteota archaeon]|nr:hypothetical protein [Thermoproteota archaeon]